MRRLAGLFIILLCSGIYSQSSAFMPSESNIQTIINNEDNPVVYYFHATRRCVTCEAVEVVARKAVRENYGDEIEFIVINREDEKNKALVEKYKISGQTLLIVKGEKVENLTNMAFMNARKKPEKVKDEIVSAIESLNK